MVLPGGTMKKITLQYKYMRISNEKGFVLVTSLLILVVITLMALAIANTTSMEILIAGNEREYQEQFFKADAGVNTLLALNTIPNNSLLPANFTNPFDNCNDVGNQTPLGSYSLDGDATNDVSLYLLSKFGPPTEIQIASCATSGNATAEIIAGIEFSLSPGAPEETINPTDY